MSFNERDVHISESGINRSGNHLPSFLEVPVIANETTAYPTQREVLTVGLLHQTRFGLAQEPPAGSIRSVVINRKTYFEPDFRIEKKALIWQLGVLPVGTVLTFEAVGAEQQHRYKQVLPITHVGQRRFELLTEPRGYDVEVFLNGFFFGNASGAFRIRQNYLEWASGGLKPTDRLVIILARTAEGAELQHYEAVPVQPSSPNNFRLSLQATQPHSSRVYFRGLRYFVDSDYAVAGDDVSLLTPLQASHGELVTFAHLADSTYFKKVNETGRLGRQVFRTTTRALSAPLTGPLPIDNPSKKSLLSVNGLVYVQGSGYTLSQGALTWDDALNIGVGDVLSLLGFVEQPAADAVKFAEFTGYSGFPTFDLNEKAADIRKSLVVVSAGETYGGEMYVGSPFLQFPSNRQVTWAGPFPLLPTDRVTVVFFKSLMLAARLTLETHQVTVAESGKPLVYSLRRPPVEPSAVIAALNGARIVQPTEFIVNDNAVLYHDAVVPVKALDVLTFLYR
jgi:hypothetical protein